MPIENRNLEPGTRLVANYKKQRYVCTVEAGDEGEGRVYVLEDETKHKSPSSAGSKVMGGKAVNGWRFWSLEADELQTDGEPDKDWAKAKAKAAKKTKKVIYKAPNQQNMAEGKTRWFCVACMKSFVNEGEAEPQVCPQGHRTDDPEQTASVGVPEKEAVAE